MKLEAAEASFLIDDRKRIVDWTGAAAVLLGVSAASARDRPCYEVVRGRDSFDRALCGPDCPALRALKDNHLKGSCLLAVDRPAGGRAWLRCNLAALPQAPGGALLTLREVRPGTRTPHPGAAGFAIESPEEAVAAVVQDLAALAVLATSLPPGPLDTTVGQALEWLWQTTGAEAAELFLTDPHGREMLLTAYRGPFRTAFAQISRFAPGEGFPGLVLSREEALLTDELPTDSRYLRTQVKERGFRSYVCVPLRGSHGVLGALNVASRRPDLGRERTLRIMSWASRPIAIAIQGALLQARQAGGFVVAQRLQSPEQTFEHLVRAELRRLIVLGSATDGLLLLADAGGRGVARQLTEGRQEGANCPVLRVSGFEGCAAFTGEQAVTLSGPRANWPPRCRQTHTRGSRVHCLPLAVGGQKLGVAQIFYAGEVPSPPTRYLAVLLEAAEQTAEAIAQGWAALQEYERTVATLGRLIREPTREAVQINSGADRPTTGPGHVEAKPLHPLLDIRCLGPFALYHQGRLVTPDRFPRRAALTLLKILLMYRGRPVASDGLMEMLQPGADPQAGLNRLHVLVHTLRRVLEPDGQGTRSQVIRNHHDRYYFNRELSHRLDLQEFLDAADAGKQLERADNIAQAITAYELAVSLYRGDLFEDEPYAEWCWEERETLREQYLDIVERLAGLTLDQGQIERSIDLYRRALRIDPLREQMHFGLIQALWLAGRPAEALRQYGVCRHVLQREVNTGPGPEIERLAERIRSAVGT